ncbi:MAG: sigma-54-dependent transcriptional regulator [Planctomycetota bacterium]
MASTLLNAKIVTAFRYRDLARIDDAIREFEVFATDNPDASAALSAIKWREHYENFEAIYEGREPPHASTPAHRLQVIKAEAALLERNPNKAMKILSNPEPGMSPAFSECLKLIALGAMGDVSRMRSLMNSAQYPIWPTIELQCLVQEGRWSEAKILHEHLRQDAYELEYLNSDRNILAGITPLDWIRLENLVMKGPSSTTLGKNPMAQPFKSTPPALGIWFGKSHRLARARQQLERLSSADIPVTVIGPSGCGKSLAARLLHESGSRSKYPLVFVTCASIMESLMESEIFGHVRGAFTGAHQARVGLLESAGKGTVVLEEIGDLPLRIQAILLRVLEERQVRPLGSSKFRPLNCRFVATSSTLLETLVEKGRLRNDLMYRLNAAVVSIPSLASRKGDIAHLARHFVSGTRCHLAPDLLKALLKHSWPGNVRQLKNLMEQILMHSPGKQILGANDIPQEHRHLFWISDLPLSSSWTSQGTRLSPGERQRRIHQLAVEQGAIYPRELHSIFPNAHITLHRDLKSLMKDGRIKRRKHSHAYEPT